MSRSYHLLNKPLEDITVEDATQSGIAARKGALPIESCPYTNDPENFDLAFAPGLETAWKKGWTAELHRQYDEAMKGKP